MLYSIYIIAPYNVNIGKNTFCKIINATGATLMCEQNVYGYS